MAYGLYRQEVIKKIKGNPRSVENQKGLIMWADSKNEVLDWIKKWGTKKQKQQFVGGQSIPVKKPARSTARQANSQTVDLLGLGDFSGGQRKRKGKKQEYDPFGF